MCQLIVEKGQREKELSFPKGAIIDLLHTVNENWLEGMVGQTKGIFPTSYVQVGLQQLLLRQCHVSCNYASIAAHKLHDERFHCHISMLLPTSNPP